MVIKRCRTFVVMEEQFVLRVPPSVAERLDRLLGENASTDDKSLDLSFEGQKKKPTFCIDSVLELVTIFCYFHHKMAETSLRKRKNAHFLCWFVDEGQ